MDNMKLNIPMYLFEDYTFTDELDLVENQPAWRTWRFRGFYDFTDIAVNEVLLLIEECLPFGILDWGFSNDQTWWFKAATFLLRLHPSAMSPDFFVSELIAIAAALPFTAIVPVRQDIEKFIHQSSRSLNRFLDVGILVLQVVEKTVAWMQEILHGTVFTTLDLTWTNSNALEKWKILQQKSEGLNPLTVRDVASKYLAMTPKHICELIPKSFRILHMEPVVSDGLAEGFLEFQEILRKKAKHDKLEKLRSKLHPHSDFGRRARSSLSHAEITQEMVRPRLTFHGTAHMNVPSILRNGFRLPGTEVEGMTIASPRSGAIFRRGIYSSQSAGFAMSFSTCHSEEPVTARELPGFRLIVCATLTGRTLFPQDDDVCSPYDQIHGPRKHGFDSHFNGDYEYIVHDSRAMLPCYVVHLDMGAPQAISKVLRMHGKLHVPYQSMTIKKKPVIVEKSPGDLKREEEARKAAAMKWFPYGYGPSTGTNFKVLDIAPVDEDEEPNDESTYNFMMEFHRRTFGHEQKLHWLELLEGIDGAIQDDLIDEAEQDDDASYHREFGLLLSLFADVIDSLQPQSIEAG